ncbi:MAG TPA: tripartite tricarboxylate transporter substrate binding protein [Burkholderiales bacterium]|nr:tripartite tricarboxylate transporter substrate binding protein [Burkholderiales bacterium]
MMHAVLRAAVAATIALGALAPLAAGAQTWPTKPVKFIVPYPPGGSTDPMARLIAVKLSDSLGQPFVVENRSGASGTIGTAFVAKSPADGYTFVFVFDYHAVNPFLIPNLPFDTVRDLAPVTLIGTAPMAIATAAGKPYRSFTDVVAAAKAKPGTVSIGSVGNGSLGHLTMVLVQQASGIRLIHIPYKGGGPMTADAVGGQIDLAIGSVAVITPHVKGGKLRAIAVTGDTRSRALPDVAALAEQGLPGFSALAWWAVFAPAGVPKPIMDKFHAELVKAFNLPDVRKLLNETLGIDLIVGPPEGLQKWLADEMQRWGNVVRDNNIRAD